MTAIGTSPAALADALAAIVGPDGVRRGAGLQRLAISGCAPALEVAPADAERAARVLRLAADGCLGVAIWGGGTHQGFGAPPARYDLALSTRRLVGVVEHLPESLTATFAAGSTLADVAAHLTPRGQFLPVELSLPDRATVGGLVATGAGGATRLRHGAPRDRLLGVEIASADGRVTRFGGKVVKNVAGYDMSRLYCGSFGTLGLIASATFKLAPTPRGRALVLAGFDTLERAWSLVERLRAAPFVPDLLDVLDPGASTLAGVGRDVFVVVRLAGSRDVLARECRETLAAASSAGACSAQAVDEGGLLVAWPPLRDLGATAAARVRVGVPPAATRRALELLAPVAPARQAQATLGVVHALWPDPPAPAAFVDTLAHLRADLEPLSGYACVESCPDDARHLLGPDGMWGPPGPDLALMRSLKTQLDPAATLNPGRFLGGM